MNKKQIIASIISSLNKLDQQKHYKIVDKIFNNLKIAQNVELKTKDEILDELREYAVSPEALRAGYRSLSLKYHPDKHSGSEIAGENMKLLNQAYGRLKASFYSNNSITNQHLTFKPISDLHAEIVIEIYEDHFLEYLNSEDITKIYIDYLKYTKYWRTRGKPGEEAPVKTSFSEADLDGIIESIAEYGSEHDENIISISIELFYDDMDGKQNSESATFYFNDLIEEYKPKLLS